MDTVIIKITGPRKFKILNRSWFVPELTNRRIHDLSPTELRSLSIYLRHFVFHPPYAGQYLPKVEIYEALNRDRDEVVYTIQLTFSVPKLLFGNSLQEVSDADFEKVLYKLRKALEDVGIQIESEVLANAKVSAFHLCKNVLLPPEIRMKEVLDELGRVDMSKVVDITKVEYKHGGQSLHIYSGTRERVFYDKIADAMRPMVKRKDKGRLERERALIERCGLDKHEVFRYEYRVKKGQAVLSEINAHLGRDPKTSVKFKDLFTPDLCKNILLKSWRDLIKRPENQLALLGPVDDLGLLSHIITEARKHGNAHSLNRALISYGLASAIRDNGAKEVRRVISRVWSADHPERLTKRLVEASELTKGLPYSNSIAFIEAGIERYQLMTRMSWVLAV